MDRACPYVQHAFAITQVQAAWRRHYSSGHFTNFARRSFCYVGVKLSIAVSIGEDGIPTKRRRMYVPSAIHRCRRSRARNACHALAKLEVQGHAWCVPSILLTPVHTGQITAAFGPACAQSPITSRHVCRCRQGLNVPNYRAHVHLIGHSNRSQTQSPSPLGIDKQSEEVVDCMRLPTGPSRCQFSC